MDRGDDTKHGIYLGTRMVDRETRLSRADATTVVDKLGTEGDHDNLINLFQDRVVVHVFEKDGSEVEIPVEDFKE